MPPSDGSAEPQEGDKLVRVVVVDDHHAVRAGLERLLGRAAGVVAVAALADERDLLELLDRDRVDVVVLDYDLERGCGLATCLRLKQLPSPPGVVVYSGYAGATLAMASAVAQADAMVSKAEPVEVLLESIRRLSRGERLLASPACDLRRAAGTRLRPEDLAVMALLLDRARIAEIGDALAIAPRDAMARARRVLGVLQARRAERYTHDPMVETVGSPDPEGSP